MKNIQKFVKNAYGGFKVSISGFKNSKVYTRPSIASDFLTFELFSILKNSRARLAHPIFEMLRFLR
jgi:hypothetical protein